jgi:oligopeptide transport system substrate-binding protein
MEGILLFKRSISLILVMMLVLTAFVGCSQPAEDEPADEPTEEATDEDTEEATDEDTEEATEEPAEQVLNWNLGANPKTIDPGLNGASDGGHVINNTFEGLMREVEGNLEPAMAESYEVSEDQMTYTFNMRDGVMWSDGEALTAYDFEYAWNRVLDPVTASEYSWIYGEANVETFEAVDEDTFVVNLKAPTPWFLGLTTFYTFFPVREDAVAAKADGLWAKDPELAISNGPFKLAAYETGSTLVFEKNDNYWRADEVMLETINAEMIVEASTALTAYQAGELDIIMTVPSAEIPGLIAEDPTFNIFPMLGTYYYSFNVDVEPLDDVKVRRALTLAIDRKAIVETVSKGGQLPAKTMIPTSLKDAEGNVFQEMTGVYGIEDTANVEEAKALLAEAGYPEGEGFPELELLYNTSEGHQKIAVAIQEMWKENLGVNITLANQEWAVFQDTRTQGNFQIAREGWIGDYTDPLTFLGMFKTGSPMNHTQWSSEKYDQLLADSMTATGQERFELLFEADKELMESAVVMPVYYYTDLEMISNDVSGWELNGKNTFYFGRVEMVN